MILEKEDWEEPECCFRPHIAAAEAVHTGRADGGSSVREVIQGFDRLLDRDAKREAAIYLEDWMARYEEAGDWASQITILNEMMGFYRNSGEREKGLAAVEKGLALVGDHGLGNAGFFCKRYGFEYYHPDIAALDDEAVRECKEHGIGINAWTVNDLAGLEKLYEWDCEGIITNYPGVPLEWLKGRGK